MYDIHIEEFYRDCAIVLLHLYQSFPRKGTVFVEDIAGPDTPDEFGLHSPRFDACFGAMLWLESEGYLSYEATIKQEAIDQCCLSSLGLRLLNHISAESPTLKLAKKLNHLPNIELIRHSLKNETSTTLAQVMIQLLGEHRR